MSTSKLQRYTSEQLYRRFGKYGLVENRRPGWLVSSKGERLELDFFIDKLSVAVEVQGGQHVEFTPLFHATEHDFTEQLRRDREKKDLCDRAGICLLYVYKRSDIEVVLYEVYTKIESILSSGREGEFPSSYTEYYVGHAKRVNHAKGKRTPKPPKSLQERIPDKIGELQSYLDNKAPSRVFKKHTIKKMERLNRRIASGEVILQDEQMAVVRKVNRRVGIIRRPTVVW